MIDLGVRDVGDLYSWLFRQRPKAILSISFRTRPIGNLFVVVDPHIHALPYASNTCPITIRLIDPAPIHFYLSSLTLNTTNAHTNRLLYSLYIMDWLNNVI